MLADDWPFQRAMTCSIVCGLVMKMLKRSLWTENVARTPFSRAGSVGEEHEPAKKATTMSAEMAVRVKPAHLARGKRVGLEPPRCAAFVVSGFGRSMCPLDPTTRPSLTNIGSVVWPVKPALPVLNTPVD